MNFKKAHYYSGIFIALFIALHLCNHFFALFGPERHIAVMNALRPFYRNVVVETMLLSAVALQIASGWNLYRNYGKATGFFNKLQILSGLYLAVFFLIHLSAVLAGRFILQLDTNLYFGAAGLNSFPFNLFFIPYYGLAILAFFGHIAAIHALKMKQNILGLSPGGQSVFILLSGIVLMFLLFYGLTNQFEGLTIPEEYGILIGK